MPLLETRCIMYRQPFPLSDLPHLDLLFSARSLWKHKHESCRLFHLAQQIVEAERAEDIPSAEIPSRYFEFLRTGNFSLMEPVLYHNQEDILSLLGLVIAASKLFSEGREQPDSEDFDAMDLIGVGKVFESAGHVEKSMELFQRALEGDLPQELALNIKRKLSYHFKKNEDWERAISLWQDLSREDQLFCYKELAMYFEHKTGKLEDAKRMAEEGLTISMNVSLNFQRDFEHRLERLNDKIRRLQAKAKKGRP
jgi:tetratricopeptide (TPR) repeat protein